MFVGLAEKAMLHFDIEHDTAEVTKLIACLAE
jgi:hypothetical protein